MLLTLSTLVHIRSMMDTLHKQKHSPPGSPFNHPLSDPLPELDYESYDYTHLPVKPNSAWRIWLRFAGSTDEIPADSKIGKLRKAPGGKTTGAGPHEKIAVVCDVVGEGLAPSLRESGRSLWGIQRPPRC